MARIHGTAGKSAFQIAARKREKVLCGMLIAIMVFTACIGALWGATLWKCAWISCAAILILAGLLVCARWWSRKFELIVEENFRESRLWQRGYEGERVVGELLESSLPDTFHVFNDVHFPGRTANIDHIVIGPSGIFVLDTKNWRGTVSLSDDGKTLFINGEPDKNNTVNVALSAALDVRDKLRTLTNKDYFVKSILVFPRAKVSPRFNTTVELQQDDYLIDKRLTYNEKRTMLPEGDVKIAVQALKALFREDVS